jgi:sulfotransferase family protein
VPDFFIVGHPKSGTSAMYRMLRYHPQIHMPRKEPSFFVPELLANTNRYAGGIDDYMSLFQDATPQQRVGEATTWYLWSQRAASRIAQAQPRARIVAILREPASFLRSLHLQFIRSDVETEPDLRNAIALERPRREGRQLPRDSTRPRLLAYSEHVRYVEQLRRYHAVFASEQVLVLIYEDFRADNEGTVRRVLRFLDVDDAAPVEVLEANTAAGVRSPRVNQFVRSLYLGRAPAARVAKAAIKALSSQRTRHGAMAALSRAQADRPPPVDGELMRELRHRFRDEVAALSEYLDRDLLTYWEYDKDGG